LQIVIKLNDYVIIPTIFPDGTSQVWKIPTNILFQTNEPIVTWIFDSENEFIQLAQLKDLLDKNQLNSNLVITYLPYARQDKFVTNETTFALHTFAKLLNTLQFSKIVIIDPHSKTSLDLIKNSVAAYPISEVKEVVIITNADCICYPDRGAAYKYQQIYNEEIKLPVTLAHKSRDKLTGQILSTYVDGDVQGKSVLIIDDIVDGGATFIGLAEGLYAKGAKEVNLFVTHGLFSKGTEVLFNSGINRIFTADGEVSRY